MQKQVGVLFFCITAFTNSFYFNNIFYSLRCITTAITELFCVSNQPETQHEASQCTVEQNWILHSPKPNTGEEFGCKVSLSLELGGH